MVQKMKRIFLTVLALSSLTGCGDSDSDSTSSIPGFIDTNLTWQDEYSSEQNTLTQAKYYCQNLESGDFGWRLPTIDELSGLYNIRDDLKMYERNFYWSSTYAGENNYYGASNYKGVDFSDGRNTLATDHRHHHYIRCVRD